MTDTSAVTRDVRFQSDGVACSAWHLEGAGDSLGGPGGRPCVVMAHGAMGTRDSGLLPYAEAFAQAGFDVLLFDFRFLGDSGGTPRQLVSLPAQHADYRAAVAFARELPGVDPDRIVLWGTSYSGGHVLELAARDPRVAAVIAQVPAMDGLAEVRATLRQAGAVQLTRRFAHALRDALGSRLGLGPHRLPVFGAPGTLAMVTSPDAEPGFAAIAGPSYRNEACARLLLQVGFHRSSRFARRLRRPLLIQTAEQDTVVSSDAARRTAAKAGAELVSYPIEHFEIYVGDAREQAVTDQLSFLRRHLAPTTTDDPVPRRPDGDADQERS